MSKDGYELEDACQRLFLGVDVGTGSVRVGLFTEKGVKLGIVKKPEPIQGFRKDLSINQQKTFGKPYALPSRSILCKQ